MIPETFEVLGTTWSVKKVKDLKDDKNEKVFGLCHAEKASIELHADLFKPENFDLLMHTWEHEKNHAIWDTLNWEISNDEDKVDLDAGIRWQIMKSSEGEIK